MQPRTWAVGVFMAAGILGGAPAATEAQPAPTFTPTPWKDCSRANCDAGEAFLYLLWSRESDGLDCRALFELTLGMDRARERCLGLLGSVAPFSGWAAIDELRVVNGLRQFLNTQTSTFPLGSSSAGFSFKRVQGLRILETNSFGPMFAERPFTSGRGNWGVTFNLQHTRWRALDGISLTEIAADLSPNAQPVSFAACPSTPRLCPSLRWSTELDLASTTAVVGASVGVRDNLDVSISVPIVSTTVAGIAQRWGGYRDGQAAVQSERSAHGRSTGLADVSTRLKWVVRGNLSGVPSTSSNGGVADAATSKSLRLAAMADIRWPTGNADRLVGSGQRQFKVSVLGAYARELLPLTTSEALRRGLSPHFNVGYTWAGRGITIGNPATRSHNQLTADFDVSPSDELNVTLGVDAPVVPDRMTISADYVGRVLRDSARFTSVAAVGERNGQWFLQPFLEERDWAHLGLGIFGAKIKLSVSWLVAGNIIVAASETGLTPAPTFTIGIERVFAGSAAGRP